MISAPGVYPNISTNDYLKDPCTEPSLSQSIAKILLDRSPLHAWYAHPRLNTHFKPDNATKFDIGNVAHAMLIGRGREIVVLDYPDWRTKKAQEARAEANAAGKLAILASGAARAGRMVQAAHEQLELRGMANLFQEGEGSGEVCIAWQEKEVWLRQLIDWLTKDYRIVADYKTTDLSVAPSSLPSMMMNAGWPLQAAMAERGLDALHPESIARRQYLFVVQEAEPPHQLNVVQIGESVMHMARKRLQMAIDTWRICLNANRWPGYDLEILTPNMPAWAEAQWLELEMAREISNEAAENLSAG
jgi:hypothetical protein